MSLPAQLRNEMAMIKCCLKLIMKSESTNDGRNLMLACSKGEETHVPTTDVLVTIVTSMAHNTCITSCIAVQGSNMTLLHYDIICFLWALSRQNRLAAGPWVVGDGTERLAGIERTKFHASMIFLDAQPFKLTMLKNPWLVDFVEIQPLPRSMQYPMYVNANLCQDAMLIDVELCHKLASNTSKGALTFSKGQYSFGTDGTVHIRGMTVIDLQELRDQERRQRQVVHATRLARVALGIRQPRKKRARRGLGRGAVRQRRVHVASASSSMPHEPTPIMDSTDVLSPASSSSGDDDNVGEEDQDILLASEAKRWQLSILSLEAKVAKSSKF
eukprot:6470023-Amphidinium_carterae.1